MSGLLKEVFLRDPIPLPSPQVQVCAKQAKEDLRAAAAVKPPLGHAGNNKVFLSPDVHPDIMGDWMVLLSYPLPTVACLHVLCALVQVKPAKPGKIDVWGSPSCEGCMREVLSFKRNKVHIYASFLRHDFPTHLNLLCLLYHYYCPAQLLDF